MVHQAKPAKKTKPCPQCGSRVGPAVKECLSCDYKFTSKSVSAVAASAPSFSNLPRTTQTNESLFIRSRFPFEPEREEDGSLLIEKILGRRLRTDASYKRVRSSIEALRNMTAVESKGEYEYLVKYKTLSYLHVQWLTATDITAMNKGSNLSLMRYLGKIDRGEIDSEDGDIDPT